MNEFINPKANAWDHLGGLFWTIGRKSARPSPREIDLFLAEFLPGAHVVVVGASSKELTKVAASRGFRVTTLDFSPL